MGGTKFKPVMRKFRKGTGNHTAHVQPKQEVDVEMLEEKYTLCTFQPEDDYVEVKERRMQLSDEVGGTERRAGVTW